MIFLYVTSLGSFIVDSRQSSPAPLVGGFVVQPLSRSVAFGKLFRKYKHRAKKSFFP